MYIFRDVDGSGNKFRTSLVVASRPYGPENFYHYSAQRTNKREEIKYCNDQE